MEQQLAEANWLYPKDLKEAAAVQRQMSQKLSFQDTPLKPRTLCGMDVSNHLIDEAYLVYAVAVLLDASTLETLAVAAHIEPSHFPYQTGFLAFREAPSLVKAYHKLPQRPDALLIDGHGIAHPRRMGIASHLGILLDRPSFGVGKTRLIGKGSLQGEEVYEQAPLMHMGEEIGTLLRSKKRCNPLIISPGHRISLKRSVEITLSCLRGYRLPEPTRLAHFYANLVRKNEGWPANFQPPFPLFI
ncbi:MAG: deoxyribonuclease [Chlamydiales bacterium]|jgi:deoxyribonuclease V|nr:deoxyribonuclease [Chlamydiales bacterium]